MKNKSTTIVISGESWRYSFQDSRYDFVIRITDPQRNEYSFIRSFFRKGWSNKIRKPFVTPDLVNRYIKLFVRRNKN